MIPDAGTTAVILVNGHRGWGKTGKQLETKHCSECDGASFSYSNGHEWSIDGVRGYRCNHCGTIKPEADPIPDYCRSNPRAPAVVR